MALAPEAFRCPGHPFKISNLARVRHSSAGFSHVCGRFFGAGLRVQTNRSPLTVGTVSSKSIWSAPTIRVHLLLCTHRPSARTIGNSCWCWLPVQNGAGKEGKNRLQAAKDDRDLSLLYFCL